MPRLPLYCECAFEFFFFLVKVIVCTDRETDSKIILQISAANTQKKMASATAFFPQKPNATV